jgi:hypothetical protein
MIASRMVPDTCCKTSRMAEPPRHASAIVGPGIG